MKRIDTWMRANGMKNTMADISAVSTHFGNTYGGSCMVCAEGVWRIGCAWCFVALVHESKVNEYISDMRKTFPELETEESRGFRPSV